MSTTKEITTYFKRNLPLDEGLEGADGTFPVRLRRFNVDMLIAFQRGYARVVSPESEKHITRRPDDALEQEQVDGVFVIADDEIRRRRLAEMTTEQRASYDKALEIDNAFVLNFCHEQISQHVWLAPGDVLTVVQDDESIIRVTSVPDTRPTQQPGAKLAEAFRSNLPVLIWLVKALHHENTLSSSQKKVLRSLSGSTASSPRRAAGAAPGGATPAATAAPVETAGSVLNGAASAAPGQIPSGSDALVANT